MYEIAIINPRRIKRKARKSRLTKRTGAKVMAKKRKRVRKMSAKQKKYFGKRRGVARVSAPKRRRRTSAKRRPAVGYVSGSARIRRRKMNPRRRHVSRRRRSNPRFSLGGITHQLLPAAYGAGGAIALDIALGYIPLPAMLATGYPKHAVRIVGALGIGWLAGKFLKGKAQAIGQGALTVAVYGLLKDVLVQFAPSVKGLGDYEEILVDGYMDPAARVGSFNEGVGAYLQGGFAAQAEDSLDVDGVGAYLQGVDY
jgi:hypothetical protein